MSSVMEILKFMFSDLWIFVGMIILIGMFLNTPIYIIKHLNRRANIKNNGWPPSHLDADGDFKENGAE